MKAFTSIFLASSWAAIAHAAPSCRNLTITVSTSANNVVFPANLTTLTADLLESVIDLPTKLVSGTFDIAARYCEPEHYNASRRDTLQILSHGVTYTKEYWSGLAPPGQGYNGTKYSYIDFASKEGYPTLAYDRICNGGSSTPSGLLACQVPLNTEILYALIQQARQGQFGNREFKDVVPVCHSEGSVICQFLMQTRPDAVDTHVLTGFTNHLLLGAPGSYLAGLFLPAALALPDRFGSLLDPTYQVATSQRGVEGIFYYGDYDSGLAAYDYQNRHPLTLGELATAPLSQLPALDYTGSVFVLNGAQDEIFCANLPTDPVLGFMGRCGSGETSVTAQLRSFFPKADFEWSQTDQCGHDVNLHKNNKQSFAAIQEYLDGMGL